MSTSGSVCATARPLGQRQKRMVERFLPLVGLVLRRHPELGRRPRPGRERRDLWQEGCLALAEAVRSHDPARHGKFAPFALARIRFAMSVYAREQANLIRVPFCTQRRRNRLAKGAATPGELPESPPRTIALDRLGQTPVGGLVVRPRFEETVKELDHPTVGDLLRRCYDRAHRQAIRRMKRARGGTPWRRRALARCSRERWEIPEPEARLSQAELAADLGCTERRVLRYEEQFRRHVADDLRADVSFAALRRMERSRPEGLEYRPTRAELDRLRTLKRTASRQGDRADPGGQAPERNGGPNL